MSRQFAASNSAVTGTAANADQDAPGVQTRAARLRQATQARPVGQDNRAPPNSDAVASDPAPGARAESTEVRRSERERKPRMPRNASPSSNRPNSAGNGNGRKRGGANGRNGGNGSKKPRDEWPTVEDADQDDYENVGYFAPIQVAPPNRGNSVVSLRMPNVENEEVLRRVQVEDAIPPAGLDEHVPQNVENLEAAPLPQPDHPHFVQAALQLDGDVFHAEFDRPATPPQENPQALYAEQVAPEEHHAPQNLLVGVQEVGNIDTWSTEAVVEWVGQILEGGELLARTQRVLLEEAIRGDVLLSFLHEDRRADFMRYARIPWGHMEVITREVMRIHNFEVFTDFNPQN